MPRNLFDVLKSAEYRSAWLKKMYGMADSQFTEEEKRALGDAITTTATTFVQSTAEVQGINNGGLLIPTTIREDILANISKVSPFFRDVRKLAVNGLVNLPYLHGADDAAWVEETTCTPKEGMEFRQVQLTGHELVKNVEITWKLEGMAFDSFASFIIEELSNKMGKALAKGILYGTGVNQPTGALTGLSPITNANPIELIKLTKASLGEDEQIGAKVYLSGSIADAIQYYKDANNSYPYLAGLPRIGNLTVEVDPFLTAGDLLIGNPSNYIMNENTPIRVDRFVDGPCRKVTFGGYAVVDGKPKAGSFALGQLSV